MNYKIIMIIYNCIKHYFFPLYRYLGFASRFPIYNDGSWNALSIVTTIVIETDVVITNLMCNLLLIKKLGSFRLIVIRVTVYSLLLIIHEILFSIVS